MKNWSIISALCFVCLTAYAQSWSEVGPLTNPFNSNINALAADHLGNVYAAGHFYKESKGYLYVAKWNGTEWSELGTGTKALNANGPLYTITTDLLGNVYAAGNFYDPSNNLYYAAKWDGSNWIKLGVTSMNAHNSIMIIATDANQNVYAGGRFKDANNNYCVSKWDGSSWTVLGSGAGALNANGVILSLAVTPQGTVYAAGEFKNAAGDYYVAKWDGVSWSEADGAVKSYNGTVQLRELALDAAGNVYAGGFSISEDRGYIAKWDGTTWIEPGGDNVLGVHSIETVTNDPFGNLLVSSYTRNSGNGVELVHQWDGMEWTILGTGEGALPSNKYFVNSLISDPSGNIYAAGDFTNANNKNIVVKWDPEGTITGSQKENEQIIRLYPNPLHNVLTLDAPVDGYVTGYDCLGSQVMNWQVTAGVQSTSALQHMPSGLYLLIFHYAQGSSIPVKILKE